jgi:hypothetical protein
MTQYDFNKEVADLLSEIAAQLPPNQSNNRKELHDRIFKLNLYVPEDNTVYK